MPRTKSSDPKTYTKPELRDRIKAEIVAGEKGGNPGQWSARKAQLVTQEYEREGGGYKKPRNSAQKNLKKWGDEHWTTSDKKPAKRTGGTTRYLPKEAWAKLTPKEKSDTNKKKQQGSREGRQFVANTLAAVAARKKVVKKTALKREKSAGKQASKRTPAKP